MRQYMVFMNKEILEFIRTYKLLVLFAVFMILGIMNPLTAKLLPYIMGNFMPEGLTINIADPTAMDSWTQFYKNVPQMGLVVLVLIFAGIISNEYINNTLVNMLTKGLKPATLVLSKVTVAMTMWTGAYWCCFLITYGYTEYYWDQSKGSHFFFAALYLWIFGIFLIACVTAASSFFKNFYGSLIVTGAVVVIMYIISLAPKTNDYNPLSLASGNMNILNGVASPGDYKWSVAIALILSVVFTGVAILGISRVSFRRWK
ncbi:ABC transporter permease [Aminicella lysinilytica]|uniref:ABC-2 type transport system permease protein n=1 Tax=Aminicella lysinilytica TaxID=433323 RepID=A0A4R6PWZ0_9FIRM|nr:ABC transporter permease [Aminicella lysinilytica]TDP49398.1 ABC-2 type transport system permease protein [Aminicella lysinilytica]